LSAGVDYEVEYNNRARVPENPSLIAGWARDAAAYRQRYAPHPIPYGPGARHSIDFFSANGNGPIVVFIHGGYWQALDGSFFSHCARGLNAHGITVAVPTYDLCPAVTVEEIIRNHQAYKAYQESIQPRYIARDATKLRFSLEGSAAIEATIAGDYFSEPHGRADWVWQDFYINGVKWKYGRIPELPLLQPEKLTQLPLDIHLTNEYRYQLVRDTDLLGYHVYEVRFEPPPNAPVSLPLYRGTVWIDTRSWARIRISMIQLNLTGEVLSNEERVDFQPFDQPGGVRGGVGRPVGAGSSLTMNVSAHDFDRPGKNSASLDSGLMLPPMNTSS